MLRPLPCGRGARVTPCRSLRSRPRPLPRARPRLPRRPRRSPSAASASSSSSLIPRGTEQVASTSCGSSRKVTPSIAARSSTRTVPPTSSAEMSASTCSGMPVGSASTWISRVTCCTLPPTFEPGRLAHELDAHRRLDRPVEPHLVEIDMRERAADRMALEVLEDRVMRGRLALDHHVDDRVEARRPGQRRPELALLDDDRARVTLPVEDAGHQPLLPEAADATRADLIGSALGDLECDAIARHRRRIVAEARGSRPRDSSWVSRTARAFRAARGRRPHVGGGQPFARSSIASELAALRTEPLPDERSRINRTSGIGGTASRPMTRITGRGNGPVDASGRSPSSESGSAPRPRPPEQLNLTSVLAGRSRRLVDGRAVRDRLGSPGIAATLWPEGGCGPVRAPSP